MYPGVNNKEHIRMRQADSYTYHEYSPKDQ